MLKEKETVIRRFLITFDGLIIALGYVLAFNLRTLITPASLGGLIPDSVQIMYPPNFSNSNHFVILLISVVLWLCLLYINGMYRPIRTQSYSQIFWILLKSTFFAFLSFGSVVFLLKLPFLSRLFVVLYFLVSSTLILIEKTLYFTSVQTVRRQGHNMRRLLIVGTGRRAAKFIRLIEDHPEWGFQVLGAVDDEPGRGIEKVGSAPIIGSLEDIPQLFRDKAVDEVVFIVPRSRLNHLVNAIHDCEIEGVVVTVAADLFEMELAKSSVTELEGQPLVHFMTTRAREWQLFVKRFFDLILSGFGLLVLTPVLMIFAALVKLSSPGPVFFKQKRQGLNGRIFTLYKFRTMRRGAHEILSDVKEISEMDTPEFRKKKIQWITPIGRFLRKFSIDELPQLFNVFVGHMSIVGPRPTVPDEVAKYKTWQRRRLSVKPGITCLWQISGRNKIGFEEWMKLDLEYLDNWSLWLDFKILLKTVPVVLFGFGAY